MKELSTQVIVFDQGNTLLLDPFLEVMRHKEQRFQKLFKELGISVATSQIVDVWSSSNKEVNYPYCAHFSQEEPIIQHALRQLSVPAYIAGELGPRLLIEYRRGLQEVIESDPRTQEVRETLSSLSIKGKRMGIFSNDRIVGLGMIMEYMSICPFFEYAETSESIGIEKPDARVYEHILKHFRVPPNLVTYVGDDPKRDVEPAKRMGINAVLYRVDVERYSESWRDYSDISEYAPDATISSFSELVDLIK